MGAFVAEPYMGMLSSACGRSDQSDVISSRPQIRGYVEGRVSPSLAGSQAKSRTDGGARRCATGAANARTRRFWLALRQQADATQEISEV